jgi:hypothetical protein
MSKQYSYEQIASDYALWAQFVDFYGVMGEGEFNCLSVSEKIKIQIDAFGPENDDDFAAEAAAWDARF